MHPIAEASERRDSLHESPRDSLHESPRDSLHERPRDGVHESPRDSLHERPRDSLHESPRDGVQSGREGQREDLNHGPSPPLTPHGGNSINHGGPSGGFGGGSGGGGGGLGGGGGGLGGLGGAGGGDTHGGYVPEQPSCMGGLLASSRSHDVAHCDLTALETLIEVQRGATPRDCRARPQRVTPPGSAPTTRDHLAWPPRVTAARLSRAARELTDQTVGALEQQLSAERSKRRMLLNVEAYMLHRQRGLDHGLDEPSDQSTATVGLHEGSLLGATTLAPRAEREPHGPYNP